MYIKVILTYHGYRFALRLIYQQGKPQTFISESSSDYPQFNREQQIGKKKRPNNTWSYKSKFQKQSLHISCCV